MPPINLPRIRRTEANLSLIGQPFLLRLGRLDRPVLSLSGDDGKPVHVPLSYDEDTDTYVVGVTGLYLTRAVRLRELINRAIPAHDLEETIQSIVNGTPQPAAAEPTATAIAVSVLSYLGDADVCKFAHGSDENMGFAIEELSKRYLNLTAPHRPVARSASGDGREDLLRYFEESLRLRLLNVTLSPARPVGDQLVRAAADCLHRTVLSSRFVGRYRTAAEQIEQAEFVLNLVCGDARKTPESLLVRAEIHAHRGETVHVLDLLGRLRAAQPDDAVRFARRLACIAAEQDHGDMLRCIAMLYPRSVAVSRDTPGQSPLEVAIAFASKRAVRTLLEAHVNLNHETLRGIKRATLDAILHQEHAQNHSNIIQTPEAFVHDHQLLDRRLQILAICLDAVH